MRVVLLLPEGMRESEEIRRAEGVEVAAVIPVPDSVRASDWALRAYRRLDRRAFSTGWCIPGAPGLDLAVLERVRGTDFDLLVDLSGRARLADLPGLDRMWQVEPAGVAEVLAASPTTTVRIVEYARDARRVVHARVQRTDERSVGRNVGVAWSRAGRDLASALARFARGEQPAPSSVPAATRRLPSPPATVRGVGGLVTRWLRDRAVDRLAPLQWHLAWGRGSELGAAGARLRRISPPPDRFWADPFPLHRGGRVYVFCEEVEYATNRGRIVAIEVEDGGAYRRLGPALDLEFHLSYPFLLSHEGELFMIPEQSAAGRLDCYRCTDFPLGWERHATLLDEPVADATVLRHAGRWWMFASPVRTGETSCDDLDVYHADSPFGPWTPHPRNPVVTDVRFARPAGAFYRHGGRLLRPAQDGALGYGHQIRVQEVVRLSTTEFVERPRRILTPDPLGALGVHTLNGSGGCVFVDLLQRRGISPRA